MIRLCGALAAIALFAVGAQASEFYAWSSDGRTQAGREPGLVEGALWTDPWSAAPMPPMPDDAYAFGAAPSGAGLSQDAIAAAVRFDIERLANPSGGTFVRTGPTPDGSGRIAVAFERFVQVGRDGFTYASVGFMDGRGDRSQPAGDASLEPAIVAMTSPER